VASRTVAEVEELSEEVNSFSRHGLALAAGFDSAETAARVAGAGIRELDKIAILVINVDGRRVNTSSHVHHIASWTP
jgi:hypothetical protein